MVDKGAVGVQIVNWRHNLDQHWVALRFGEIKVAANEQQHIFKVQVYLDDLDANAMRVELYAGGINGGSPIRQAMARISPLTYSVGRYLYRGTVSAIRSSTDFTARIIPYYPGISIPLETTHIVRQR
ncbi:MAG: hypothetical protein DID92_2727745388 [Candidatus Nitrotoga sp. SPKER]|nr:MAG: hypothetical protein DID92_2727745388 [Candidatus Nitrotoga sp. SPKER]